jgi:hypothetical protein
MQTAVDDSGYNNLQLRLRQRRNFLEPAANTPSLRRCDKWVIVDLMGNSKGRDNARKRKSRRKKTERLALAKKQKAAK